ncbi:MAG: hypothetical protein Ta2B_14440 [Termitinemataceae bacterium]|nr:MAG: hypothetical protein Ta2B_14440 [Termitinemataceae bacterium]
MLKVATGNMYRFITHLYNPVRGRCGYDCTYCYVKKMSHRFYFEQKPIHLVESELKADIGKENFIFVCSGCDLFHPDVPDEWIRQIMQHCSHFPNRYLWHTKNAHRLVGFAESNYLPELSTLCVTVESNYNHPISKAVPTFQRLTALMSKKITQDKMITIEPVMKFEPAAFADMILACNPVQVNIGADSGNNHLPEPCEDDIVSLVKLLEGYTTLYFKPNLKRLIPGYWGDLIKEKMGGIDG